MSQPLASSVRLPADENREQIMVQAAKLYFDLDRTQSDIAKELGLTRWQVSRLLREAREIGIVRIEIVPSSQRRPDLEVQLQKAFGLREAIVVPSYGAAGGIALESVAQAAGQYLAAVNPKPKQFGVSWGRTMAAVAHWLPQHWNDAVEVVLVNGSTNLRDVSSRPQFVAEIFSRKGNGSATILPVPAIVGKAATREALEQDASVSTVLALAESATMACFGLGTMAHDSVLVESGYLTIAQIDDLKARGAVGDILGRFVDQDGAIVDAELDGRTLGLRPDALRRKAHAIAVATGVTKHKIIRACLQAGFINVLVIDEMLAGRLLEGAQNHG